VAAHLAERQSPAMSWADSLGNMRTLDRWREAIGLVYPLETANHSSAVLTAAGRPLRRQADHPMKFGRIAGLDKPVSRLIMGCDNQRTYPHAAAMFDGFHALGGNCFDTAYIYANGLQERLLGQWMRNRAGVRDEIVVIGKGAHTPNCNPEALSAQLLESLDRLQTGFVDIYLLHRDNPEIPAGEFVAVLNEHLQAGRVRAFGGSNWSIERVEEANAYAAKHGLQPFTAVSNNLSLARMVQPVWDGCVTASDPESLAWFTRQQMALLCWSSQARGFFLEQAPASGGNAPTEAEIVRCWHSEDNFRRRERAIALAREKGVEPINIALAYVLSQPFPTFALFGPRTLEEIRTSLPGLDLELSPGELAWLNLESERHS
jgi:aryl-alcohol dehydrogenase-like predicted oxidoreductase